MTEIAASNEPTNAEKIRGLRWSIAETAANTVFVQLTFFGSVFILFLNELELSKSQIGLLLSFLPFFGLVGIFIAPRVARFGYKRTWLTFWTIRKFITMLLLLVPWVKTEFGPHVTLVFVGVIVIGFGLCRAIAMVGYFPWSQEFVPHSMRGRYDAVANLFSNFVGIISIVIASLVIDHVAGLSKFTMLFAIGVAFGLLSVWFMARVPGGAPVETGEKATSYRDMLTTLHDRNFWLFLVSLGLVTLATTPMFSFLPLFMKQQVGLTEGNIVLLQNGTLIGALTASFLVGWSCDRYGSKPVMILGLSMMLLLPIIWLFIPKNAGWSLPIAFGAAMLQGIATITWNIGFGRLLYVNVVPQDHKAAYMAVYFATVGIIGGASQLIGGYILDLTAGLSGTFLSYTYDPFTPIFLLALLWLVMSSGIFKHVRSDTSVSGRQFAGFFLRGNPLRAFESIYGYYRAKDERTTITMTERLGHAHSPLTVDELLEALIDPRFNVRYEAIISIARTNPDPRFVEALGNILHGTELALSPVAAWALGRIGDNHAIDALRKGLDSEYRSIRAQCARSLGTLGDESITPLLFDRLAKETDKGLQMAYASALGSLGVQDATTPLLDLLEITENKGARMDLALSLARIIGDERQFIRTLRQMRQDPGTTTAQALENAKRKLDSMDSLFDECIDLWAHGNLKDGAIALAGILRQLPDESIKTIQLQTLERCATQLQRHGHLRIEYLILALDILDTAFGKPNTHPKES